MPTNHPVRKIGHQPFRYIPFAHLSDVQQACELENAPTPISGGMRKALAKDMGRQDYCIADTREPDRRRAYGLLMAVCPRCRRVMYFD